MSKAIVIGGGIAGLSASTRLANEGHEVLMLEKNTSIGGRARQFQEKGFTFDMGPSWYWMPDVIEKHFSNYGRKVSDYYELERLSPAYRVYWGKSDYTDIPSDEKNLYELFESFEPGAARKLESFLVEAKEKYDMGVNNMVYNPGQSITELMSLKVIEKAIKLNIFSSFKKHVRKYFKNEKLIKLIEFPILFLGATPESTPALYSLMNYADLVLGTWYPKGGMYALPKSMEKLAREKGVQIKLGETVKSINIENDQAKGVETDKGYYEADLIFSSADYHHTEEKLMKKSEKNYSEKYWDKRTMAPSALIFYLGVDKKVEKLSHHTLFFDEDFNLHAEEIYNSPQWPSKPLFYVCKPSETDKECAPDGCENLFILMPLASGIEDVEEKREAYFNLLINRIEELTGESFRDQIIYKRSYCINDFKTDYNSYRGNAYGLANTLRQTANLKPSIQNKKIKNLFYTGQLTVPGPGVPPSIISGQVVVDYALKKLKNNHE